MWGEHGGNGGTGEKSMLGRLRGFDDDKALWAVRMGGRGSGRSELFPLAHNISKQVQSHHRAAQPRKKKSFSTLHMQTVKYKQKLWEGTALAVEAVGGGSRGAQRDAQGHVVTYTPTLHRL